MMINKTEKEKQKELEECLKKLQSARYMVSSEKLENMKDDIYTSQIQEVIEENDVKVKKLKEDANIRVFSENFSLIYCDKAKKNKNNSVIYLDIPKGCYFIELQSKNKTFTEKLIIN